MGSLDTNTPCARSSWIDVTTHATNQHVARREVLTTCRPRLAMGEPATTVVLDAPAWVLLPLEAQARGFKNTLAFRRWLRRHQVPVRRDGHRLWVRRVDVDHAIDGLGVPVVEPTSAEARAAVADAVASITTGRR